jgi:hypothetical protein
MIIFPMDRFFLISPLKNPYSLKAKCMITINFEHTFDPINIENDYSRMTFHSPQISGTNELMLVKISPHPDPYLPKVYNLGFGPLNGNGGFRDDIRLKHSDSNRVFSTVLFLGLIFLQVNPELILGIDGSDDLRATMTGTSTFFEIGIVKSIIPGISLQNRNRNRLIMIVIGTIFIGITCFNCDKTGLVFSNLFNYICNMNQGIQEKIEQFKKMAKGHSDKSLPDQLGPARGDGLAKVIRSKKDADNFMAELNSVVKRANK